MTAAIPAPTPPVIASPEPTGPPVRAATASEVTTVSAAAASAAPGGSSSGVIPTSEAPSQAQVGHPPAATGPTSGTLSTATRANATSDRCRHRWASQGVTAA